MLGLLERYADCVGELPTDKIEAFCKEIRRFLVKNLSSTGGHLASNLGVVELTVALHRVFNTESDRLVFDVGHQCYTHKILTNRRDGFPTLRQTGSMAGFPKPGESRHDAFIAGHASTSISAALGMARARTLLGEKYHCIAFLGDGALTGGMAYEALNDAGQSREPLIVVLNDNEMSITKNVGAMARHLSRLRLKPQYFRAKRVYHKLLTPLPGSENLNKMLHMGKDTLKKLVLPGTIFEQMGFVYLGPADGHDVEGLCHLLAEARDMGKPVVVHVVTKKGKGYCFSERNPSAYHGVGRFHVRSGQTEDSETKTFSQVFGETLCELAEEDQRICAITAAMTDGTGLSEFAMRFPARHFDVGIAEEHAVTMAAGMAKQGLRPVVAMYSTFLQRAFDQVIHDVAILSLPVLFMVDRAGLVGEDGETHHGVFDGAFLGMIPGLTLYAPSNFAELREAMAEALALNAPAAIRYPRGGEGAFGDCRMEPCALTEGTDATVITYGVMTGAALEAAEILLREGINLRVVKLTRLKPLDGDAVLDLCRGTVFLLEDGVSCLMQHIPGIPLNPGDRFVSHGAVEDLRRLYGIDGVGLAETVRRSLSGVLSEEGA